MILNCVATTIITVWVIAMLWYWAGAADANRERKRGERIRADPVYRANEASIKAAHEEAYARRRANREAWRKAAADIGIDLDEYEARYAAEHR